MGSALTHSEEYCCVPKLENTMMTDLFEMTPTPKLETLCKHVCKVRKEFQANDDDIKWLIQRGVLRASEIDKVVCFKIDDPSQNLYLKIRFVEPRKKGKTILTSTNLIIASHLCGKNATYNYLYRKKKNNYLYENPLNNKRFWRLKLLDLEGCTMWFDLFFDLYKNCIFDDEEPREKFLNVRKCKRLMIIDMTPRWKIVLDNLHFFEDFRKSCYSNKILLIDDLLKCGDIEANPGPVMSRLARNNNSSAKKWHNVQGLFLTPKDSDSLEIISKFLNDKLPGLVDQIGNICSATVQDSSNILAFADNSIKEDIELLHKHSKDMLSYIDQLKSKVLKVSLLVLIILILHQMRFHKTAILAAAIGLFSLFGLPQKLCSMIKEFFSTEHSVELSLSTVIVPLLGSIIMYFVVGTLPKDSVIENYSKKMNNISRGLHGTLTMHDDITKIWDNVKSFVNEQLTEVDENFLTYEEEIKIWAKDITYYSDLIKRKECTLKNEEIVKMGALWKKGLEYNTWAWKTKAPRDTIIYLNNMTRHAEQLFKFAEKSNAIDGGMRQKPLNIALFGESQIGKSNMIYLLCQDLLFSMGYTKPSDLDEQVYARMTETEFWDGYYNQLIIVRDDMLARKDDASNPNEELTETIREVNDFPMHLHCAALEDKNTYLTSKVSIKTINDIHGPIKSLSYPIAFYLRIAKNLYKVLPKPEFAKVMQEKGGVTRTLLDIEKVKAHLTALSVERGYEVIVSEDIYLLERYELHFEGNDVSLIPAGEPLIDYQTFSKRMCEQLKDCGVSFAQRQEFFKQRLNHLAQVGGDEFHDCVPDFADLIARQLKDKTLLEIENEILSGPHADEYYTWKLEAKKPRILNGVRNKIDLIIEDFDANQIYSKFISSLQSWFDKFRRLVLDVYKKYPVLSIIFTVGTLGASAYAMYKLFVPDSPRHFIADEIIDEKTYQQNIEWMGKQKLTPDEHVRLFIQNLKARHPEEAELIDANMSKHKAELIGSPGGGKEKYAKNHNIHKAEIVSSPGNGKDTRIKKHDIHVDHSAEACTDENAYDLAMAVLRNNLYHLTYLDEKNKECIVGNVVAIGGYKLLMPFHFIKYLALINLKPETVLNLTRINYSNKTLQNTISFKFKEVWTDGKLTQNAVQFKDEQNVDCVLLFLPTSTNMTCHRSIISHFTTQADLKRHFGEMKGMLISYRSDNGQVAKVVNSLEKVMTYDREINIRIPGFANEGYTQRDGYLYYGDTTRGDCGGLLFLKSSHLQRKIVGMHVSGTTGEGFSIKLTQELIKTHIEKLIEQNVDNKQVHLIQCHVLLPPCLKQEGCETPEGHFVDIGKAQIPLRQAIKSVLKPSKLHGQLTEPITKPAQLKPELLIKGLTKCGTPSKLLDDTALSIASNYVKHVVISNTKNLDLSKYARVLTHEEAIMGNETDFFSPICRTTSPGYPLNSDPKFKTNKPGKQEWMGSVDYDFTSESAQQLLTWCNELEEQCLKGEITDVICAATLKDERRPIAKVDAGKTRVFTACPMKFVVVFRKYFLGFAAYMMENRIANGSAVGTNVYSEDWDRIVRKISKVGKKVLAGDFSNFDGSLISSVLWEVFWIIDEWYKKFDKNYQPKHTIIRLRLFVHITNSTVIYHDTIIMLTHSQPSGNPFTVIINTIYNFIIIIYSYVVIVLRLEDKQLIGTYLSMEFINNNVSVIAYGDDNIINISDLVSTFFNQETLTTVLAEIGHEYTEESKDGQMHKWRSLGEITFLKRSFRFCEDFQKWIAPLDINVIFEMLNWVRSNNIDPISLLRTNIETACMEMSLHGYSTYQKFVSLLNNNITVNKVHPKIPLFVQARLATESCGAEGGIMA